MKFMREESKEDDVRPAARSVIAFSRTDVTPNLTPRTNKRRLNGRNGNYVYVSTDVLLNSIRIKFFSQNKSLLSPIRNEKIIKRVI